MNLLKRFLEEPDYQDEDPETAEEFNGDTDEGQVESDESLMDQNITSPVLSDTATGSDTVSVHQALVTENNDILLVDGVITRIGLQGVTSTLLPFSRFSEPLVGNIDTTPLEPLVDFKPSRIIPTNDEWNRYTDILKTFGKKPTDSQEV
jgi:hypothetical protein